METNKGPVSKYSHIGDLGLQQMNLGVETIQSITDYELSQKLSVFALYYTSGVLHTIAKQHPPPLAPS